MENTLRLCQKVKNVHEKIKKDVNIPEVYFTMQESKGIKFVDSQNINILNLKLYSIYYSTIANDYDRAIYAEKYIMELIKDDRQKQSDIIDD